VTASLASNAAVVGSAQDLTVQVPVVQVPVDLEVEARLAGPVTFRMAGWLAVAIAGGMLTCANLGSAWLMLAGVVLVLLGGTGALVRPAGRPVAAWLLPVAGYHRRRRIARRQRRD
jgi:hypothetical protein